MELRELKEIVGILKGLDLISWPTLSIGFENGWVQRSEIVEYALNVMTTSVEDNFKEVILLAGSELYDHDEFKQILVGVLNKKGFDASNVNNKNIESDKWRLGFLIFLDSKTSTPEFKLDKLQKLYSQFNYPEDMAACSCYYNPLDNDSYEGPLNELKTVIIKLKTKLGRSEF